MIEYRIIVKIGIKIQFSIHFCTSGPDTDISYKKSKYKKQPNRNDRLSYQFFISWLLKPWEISFKIINILFAILAPKYVYTKIICSILDLISLLKNHIKESTFLNKFTYQMVSLKITIKYLIHNLNLSYILQITSIEMYREVLISISCIIRPSSKLFQEKQL